MALEFSFITTQINSQMNKNITQAQDSTLVIFTNDFGKTKKISLNLKGLPKDWEANMSEALTYAPFKGALGESLFFRQYAFLGFTNLLLVGLGDAKRVTHEVIRRASSNAFKNLKANSAKSVTIAIETLPLTTKTKEENLKAVFEGFYLSEYTFDIYKSSPNKSDTAKDFAKMKVNILTSLAGTATSAKNAEKEARIVSEAVNFARTIGDTPGNQMNPPILGETTKKAATGTGLKVTIWDGARIKKEKMGNLHGVSLGGGEDPRLIIMEYKGGAKSKKPICFVGKGLTFDSGGISLKPGAGMEEMKYDMMGGAAVIATMLAIAKLKLKVNVIGIVPSSENMPGPFANKPGDITTARNGKTTEVNNTDAEGRLILSDALVYASEQKPEFIVDAATLTGAMVMALGDVHTGFFSRDTKLTQKIAKAAAASGETLWEMPMHEEHLKDMKGTYADLQNVSQRRGAGSAQGAIYLGEFVEKDIPWAHFDIAGTAYNNGHRLPYTPAKGASGVIVRTFVELAKQHK
ncbi:MAG: leucyl aminopeptidase [Bdellovibrionota bacterium]